ncbi:MAG: PilZ domain-containing protein [Nitrospirales bacterium]
MRQSSVTYHAGPFVGHGTAWNLSLNGWKLSSDVPLRVGQTCSLTVNLPNQPSIVVAAAIVRWVRGQEYGLETLVVEKQMHGRLLAPRYLINSWSTVVYELCYTLS